MNLSPFPLHFTILSPFHHSLSISSSFHHSLSISSSFPYSLSISSQIRLGNSVNVVMITTMGIVWRLSEAEYSLSWQLCTTFVHPPALLVILSTSSSSARNTKGRLWWVHRRQALEENTFERKEWKFSWVHVSPPKAFLLMGLEYLCQDMAGNAKCYN